MTEDPDQALAVSTSEHRAFLEHRSRNRTTKMVRSVCRRCCGFASDWVLSPEVAVQAGLDHTRKSRAGQQRPAVTGPGVPSRPWIPKPREVPKPRRRMWPMSTEWLTETRGARWLRRGGSCAADVSLRADGTYRVRIFHLDEHRQTVGEPELVGVYDTEDAAKHAADAVLDGGTAP